MAVINKTIQSPDPHNPSWSPTGVTPFWVEVAIDSTDVDATDELLVYQFPEGAKLKNSDDEIEVRCDTVVDSAGGLVVSLTIGGIDGVADFDFGSSNVGDTAGEIVGIVQDADKDAWLDVGGLYFIIEVTTAAGTEADGVYEIAGKFSGGVKKYSYGTS